jgi:TrbB protein
LDLRHKPSFYLSNGCVVCLDAQGTTFTFDTLSGVESQDLLSQLVRARLDHAKKKTQHCLAYLVAAVTLAVGVFGLSWGERSEPVESVVSHSTLSAPQPAVPTAPVQIPTAANAVADNGWALPPALRLTLPDKLRKAAERGLFTVNYSAGHARTLYVFADPGCPNCQRLEASLNALAETFNVVVFPVAVIGKDKSVAAITPVLCLPPEQRKAAWDALFDPAPEGLSLGKQKQEQASQSVESGACETANKALGINQLAYQTYRIPGTPWVISDDGRYVSQALLRAPLKLHTFLLEVADARQ